MSDDAKEWLTLKEAAALNLLNAPRSRSAWGRLSRRLRRDHPDLFRQRVGSGTLLLHRSLLTEDRLSEVSRSPILPERHVTDPLVRKFRSRLPPRKDGSHPTFDEVKAALLLLGYRA